MQNTVHFVLQGKGGIGKTYVSTILAQWLKTKSDTVLRCYDTDQEDAGYLARTARGRRRTGAVRA